MIAPLVGLLAAAFALPHIDGGWRWCWLVVLVCLLLELDLGTVAD